MFKVVKVGLIVVGGIMGISLGSTLVGCASSGGGGGGDTPSSSRYTPTPTPSSSSSSPSSSRDTTYDLVKVTVEGFNHDVYKYNNKYYALYAEKKTILAAEEHAESIGGYLLFDDIVNVVKKFDKAGLYPQIHKTGGNQITLGAYYDGGEFYSYKDKTSFNVASKSVKDMGGGDKKVVLFGYWFDVLTDGTITGEHESFIWGDSGSSHAYIVEWTDMDSIGKPIIKPAVLEPTDYVIGEKDPNNTKIYKYGDHYYALFTDKKNWIDAEMYCESVGGHLLTVGSYEENKVYNELYSATGLTKADTWLGFCRQDDNGNFTTENKPFKWVDKTSVSYTDWASGQPDYGSNNENAAHYWIDKSGQWNDRAHTATSNFICEWNDDQSFGKLKPSFMYKEVSNQEQLLAALSASSGNYALTKDIYLDSDFKYVDKVASTIYGDGHIISIPSKTIDAENKYNFIKELTGKLDNIVFEIDINTSATFDGLGGVVDTNNGTIQNCSVEGTINAPNVNRVGGFISTNTNNSKLINLTNKADIVGNNYVGGIVGEKTHSDASIGAMKNMGDIKGNDYVGGVFGHLNYSYGSSDPTLTLSGYENIGAIEGNNYVGGLFGRAYLNAAEEYYGSGSVKAWHSAKLILENSKNTGSVTGNDYVGGIVGSGVTDNSGSIIKKTDSFGDIVGRCYVGCIAGWLNTISIDTCANTDSTITINGTGLDGSTKISYVGGIVGRGYHISNCDNELDIEVKGNYVGGIVGAGYGNITNCNNSGDIISTASYAGGIAGNLYQITSVTNSTNIGNISGVDYIGGIVGRINADFGTSDQTVTIQKLNNEGTISGNNYVGGIVGNVYCNSAEEYYGSGSVKAWHSTKLMADNNNNVGNITGNDYVGGIFGKATSDNNGSKLLMSSSSSDIEARSYVGCIGGYLENIAIDDCSNLDSSLTINGAVLVDSNRVSYVGGYAGYGYIITKCNNELDINASGRFVGGIAGYMHGKITDCNNTGDIKSKESYVGGIAGRAFGEIVDCANTGLVTSETNYAGGIAGLAYQITNMKNVTNDGDVKGNNYVGGIIGELNNGFGTSDPVTTINKVSNQGNVEGNDYVAGLFGNGYFNSAEEYYGSGSVKAWHSNKAIITESSNLGNITGRDYVGGIFGKATSDNNGSNITDCSSTSTISARSYVGGIAGYLDNIQVDNCSNLDTAITISGAALSESTKVSYVGGYVGRGYIIKNCDNAVSITAPGQFVGGIIGWGYGNVTNCSNTANISSTDNYVGGIAGDLYQVTSLNKLSNTGDITGKDCVAGIVGYLNDGFGTTDATVTTDYLTNDGDISGNNYIGGLFGKIYVNATEEYYGSGSVKAWHYAGIKMVDCENSGSVTATGDQIGGLFAYGTADQGDANKSFILDCTNIPEVVRYTTKTNIADKDI